MNIPPSGCLLNINPNIGTEVTNVFLISLFGCVDFDTPITYSFGYYLTLADMQYDVLHG